MPRPKNCFLHDYFVVKNESELICNNDRCENKILKKHTSNLERHLKQFHYDLYSDYIKRKSVIKNKSNSLKPKVVISQTSRANVETAIVELFTKNGRPLHMAEDRAFKILVQPVFDALGMSVNEHHIIERIIAFAEKLKSEISDDLRGKLVSLKIDVATRQDLSVLGINVQYIKNKTIQIKTLAVKELKSSHTSEYLKNIIIEVLNKFAINIYQIFTITTDNGANMIKAVKDLDIALKDSLEEESLRITNFIDEPILDTKLKSIEANFSLPNVTGIRCSAHTLQLCVHDVLKTPEMRNYIEKVRSLVKKLRTQTYLNILKTSNYKKPILDCPTRWNSTYDMVKRLLEIRDIIESLSAENENLQLSSDEWTFAKEFIQSLEPFYTATIKLQSEQLCFSELYIIIMDLLFQVESLPSTEMTKLLINALNHRKSKLFDNEIFNAAVFLDPRIRICMEADKKERAKKYIMGLYKRIRSFEDNIPEENNTALQNKSLDVPSTSTKAKTFSEYLQSLDPCIGETHPSLSNVENDIMLYERDARLPLTYNILEYWHNKKNALSNLSEIILAVPSTQVSVERLFSSLKYILPDQRNRLSAENVENILMVRANGVFNYED